MLENTEEKVNALTKLADLIGKKTLVMWAIITTFTTGYLFIENKGLNKELFNTQGAGYERLIKRIDNVENRVDSNEVQVKKIGESKDKLDTLIDKANQKLDNIK